MDNANDIYLYEYERKDCRAVLLLQEDLDPELCPYCQGDIDYSGGKIEPVTKYTPRKYR